MAPEFVYHCIWGAASILVLAVVIKIDQSSHHRLYGVCACLHFAGAVLSGLNWAFTSSTTNGSILLSWFTLPVLYINLAGLAAHLISNHLLISKYQSESSNWIDQLHLKLKPHRLRCDFLSTLFV